MRAPSIQTYQRIAVYLKYDRHGAPESFAGSLFHDGLWPSATLRQY